VEKLSLVAVKKLLTSGKNAWGWVVDIRWEAIRHGGWHPSSTSSQKHKPSPIKSPVAKQYKKYACLSSNYVPFS